MEKKELSRFELATVKRIAQSTKSFRNKRDRILAKIEALKVELEDVNTAIERFEAPIREITGGESSEEVMARLAKENAVVEVDDTATTETTEVSPEDAVEIDPDVESPLTEDCRPNEEDVMVGSGN